MVRDYLLGVRSFISYRVLFVVGFGTLLVIGASSRRPAGVPPVAANRSLANPCGEVLAKHEGDDRVDVQIQQLQAKLSNPAERVGGLERLGWLFVAKARTTGDANYYARADQCAECILRRREDSPAAMLLRGHVFHNLHRFQETEKIARELVSRRGAPFDYGLLGDALVEQGNVAEAATAYQKMADLKPGMQSYIRGAQIRWLYGDLEGASALMRMAAGAAGPRTPEPAAWSYSRLALFELQAGRMAEALEAANAALSHQPDHAHALIARGRILLAQGREEEALSAVSRAVAITRSPEHQWLLADLLRLQGHPGEAGEIEKQLESAGLAKDPRTVALYLSTRGKQPELSVRLASLELENRQDILSHDALAWAKHAAGRNNDARSAVKRALAFGTQDARLFLHAGLIAEEGGSSKESMRWLNKADRLQQMLFPSEVELLLSAQARWRGYSDKTMAGRGGGPYLNSE